MAVALEPFDKQPEAQSLKLSSLTGKIKCHPLQPGRCFADCFSLLSLEQYEAQEKQAETGKCKYNQ